MGIHFFLFHAAAAFLQQLVALEGKIPILVEDTAVEIQSNAGHIEAISGIFAVVYELLPVDVAYQTVRNMGSAHDVVVELGRLRLQ